VIVRSRCAKERSGNAWGKEPLLLRYVSDKDSCVKATPQGREDRPEEYGWGSSLPTARVRKRGGVKQKKKGGDRKGGLDSSRAGEKTSIDN